MRYLILTNNSGGLYRFRKDLIKRLLADGHEVYAVTPFDEYVDELRATGCRLIEQGLNRRGTNLLQEAKLLRAYGAIMKQVRPDYVITYTIKPGIYGGMLASRYQIPYSVNITGLGSAFQKKGIFLKGICALWKKALKNVDHVLFQNVENAGVFQKNNIVDASKICILAGSGVNLEDFPFAEYPAETDEIRFLFIGRVMREKGMDELLCAMERLHRKYEKLSLDIVGGCEEDYAPRLKPLQDQGIIRYHGQQRDVQSFIRQAHAFVLPSYHEGMANTLLESGAMGRPLITSKIHGCLEAVVDGETGFLCEAQNTESLIRGMERFLSLPYQEKRQMGIRSHEFVAEHFDKKKVVQNTVEILYGRK
jgi:galacturonosyltransferase